jgi:HK97 family phage prohead protease
MGDDLAPLPAELVDGIQTRSYEIADLEVRSDGDGRTLVGRAVPFGVVADVGGRYRERFLPGAFDRQIGSGQVGQVQLWASHQDRLSNGQAKPIGKTVRLEERSDGLHGEWWVANTSAGNDALELVHARMVTGLSVGFTAVKGGTRQAAGGVLERSVAHLDHVALTGTPIYPGAEVLAVRSAARPLATFALDVARMRAVWPGPS